jgi:hypothetical protein
MTPAAFLMQGGKIVRGSMTVQAKDQNADRLKINVRDAWELRWWCRQFGCTEAQLKAAIDAMGAIAGNVRKYLARGQARE